jgi:hypothetical protein
MILYTIRENFWFSFRVKNTSKAALEETSEAEISRSQPTEMREGLFAKFESLIPAPYFPHEDIAKSRHKKVSFAVLLLQNHTVSLSFLEWDF